MQAGASEEKVREVEHAAESERYAEPERAAIAFAEAMTFSDRRVTDDLFARVRRHFSEAQGFCALRS